MRKLFWLLKFLWLSWLFIAALYMLLVTCALMAGEEQGRAVIEATPPWFAWPALLTALPVMMWVQLQYLWQNIVGREEDETAG